MRNLLHALTLASVAATVSCPTYAAPGDAVYETCPDAADVGANVECYPVTFMAKTEIHPKGIPLIAYLFVPKDRPAEPLPAIVFAHGSGSMYSLGNHNKGLSSKHIQWVRQYTNELGYVGLHVSSFHSRYLLPDTAGDQRLLDWENPPEGVVGGDDYRATSSKGYEEDENGNPLPYEYLEFDPEENGWVDQNNGKGGVSEIIERANDMDAAWDFLAGIRKGRVIENSVNQHESRPTLGSPAVGVGYIGEIVPAGISIDHERIFLYGTSHGGQTVMAAAHAGRALGDGNPMNDEFPAGSNRRRFAGFLDYYGGCGLHGAYNGTNFDPENIEDNSTWRPYAPFLMLHGENDSIWKDRTSGTVREQWQESECKPRIDAAKADPKFTEFLNAAIYHDTDHAFDETERDDIGSDGSADLDFSDWIAKIHSNYRLAVPFMEAIARRVGEIRAGRVPRALADFGFHDRHPYFSTFPLQPELPPQRRAGAALSVNVANGALDLEELTVERFAYYDVSCEAEPLPGGVTLDGAQCVLQFAMSAQNVDDTAWPFATNLVIRTRSGAVNIPASIARPDDNGDASVNFTDEFNFNVAASPLRLTTDAAGGLHFDLTAVLWTDHGRGASHDIAFAPVGTLPGDLTLDGHFLDGSVPSVQTDVSLFATVANRRMRFTLSLEPVDGGDRIEVSCCADFQISSDVLSPPTLPVPAPDFSDGYIALMPVSDTEPLRPGEFPAGVLPGPIPGPGNPGDGKNNGGGGALLWLLPFTFLLRRRN